jgi:hypothetical protein
MPAGKPALDALVAAEGLLGAALGAAMTQAEVSSSDAQQGPIQFRAMASSWQAERSIASRVRARTCRIDLLYYCMRLSD